MNNTRPSSSRGIFTPQAPPAIALPLAASVTDLSHSLSPTSLLLSRSLSPASVPLSRTLSLALSPSSDPSLPLPIPLSRPNRQPRIVFFVFFVFFFLLV
ncbi:hypothetical protein ACLOJK_008850 [Asimina triloba]